MVTRSAKTKPVKPVKLDQDAEIDTVAPNDSANQDAEIDTVAPYDSATNKPGMAAVSDEPDHETHSVASNGSAQSSVSSRRSFAEVVRAVPAVPARAPSPPASSSALVALPVPAPVEPPAPAGIGAPAFVAQSVPGSAKPRASGGAPVFDGPGADRAPATVGMSDQDWAALSMQEQNTILNYVTNLAPANIRAVRTSSRASTHSARSSRSSAPRFRLPSDAMGAALRCVALIDLL